MRRSPPISSTFVFSTNTKNSFFLATLVAFFEIISRVADGKVYIYILAICHMVISPDFEEENTMVF
jgi:hypothetical protein